MFLFKLRVDACKHLESLLTALDSLDECQQWVDKILDVLASKGENTNVQ